MGGEELGRTRTPGKEGGRSVDEKGCVKEVEEPKDKRRGRNQARINEVYFAGERCGSLTY